MLQSSTFKVGRYTCTLTTTDNGALTMRWKPDWPLFLSRDEKAKYRQGRDALLRKSCMIDPTITSRRQAE
jgi:hypothetical protein